MSIDFFKDVCQSHIHEREFGLCDDKNDSPAYIDFSDKTKWIATVLNSNNRNINITAIDNCVIKSWEEVGRGRCDCMLTTQNLIYFVELKDEASQWKNDAIEQLESTIQFYIENYDISIFKLKKAFACNKQYKYFQEIDNEFNLWFYRTYGFRIDVQAEIIVL